jgi:hypothetical protein
MRTALAALLVSLFAFPAYAQDDEELGDLDKTNYPMELVKRPLILADGMLEIELGTNLDFLSSGGGGGHVMTVADLTWSPFRRGQIGVETRLLVAGDFAFAVPEVGAFFEYGVHPTMALHVGFSTNIPRDVVADELGDPRYTVRAGLPMLYKLGKKAQLRLFPRWAMDLDSSVHTIDVDSRLAYQVIMPLALYLRLGLGVTDYEFNEAGMSIPVGVGAVAHPGRFFDIGAELLVADVGDDAGRDLRWMMFWIALRH